MRLQVTGLLPTLNGPSTFASSSHFESGSESWQDYALGPFFDPSRDLAGVIESQDAEWAMKKIKPARPVRQPLLAAGQVWRMAEANLQVVMVGKLLVHYKLGRQDAVRIPHSCNCIKTIEKYLKQKKALLALPSPCSSEATISLTPRRG